MPGKWTTEEQKAKVVALYKRNDQTVREIAEIVGVNQRTAERIIERAGIANRAPEAKFLTPEDEALAEQMLNEGASYHEVARTLGCSIYPISRRWPNRGWTGPQTWDFIKTDKLAKRVLGA